MDTPIPTNINSLIAYISDNPIVLLLLVWSFVWKGMALWKAARLSHKKWFIVILIINTVGILEIFYIYFIARKYKVVEERVEEKSK